MAFSEKIPPHQIARALSGFCGLRRRLECLGSFGGVALVDDYAHHPTEIAASLEAVRQIHPRRHVFCVFQPHQASRTAHLLAELAESLQGANTVAVADVFRAREGEPVEGEVTARDLAREVNTRGAAVADVHHQAGIAELLLGRLQPGDVLVTMGAGDIRRVADTVIRGLLFRRRAARPLSESRSARRLICMAGGKTWP
jgi:UDP-N-acetylmuramate--alanine ligase